jgi:outer membrane lipoprotein-sorting protein
MFFGKVKHLFRKSVILVIRNKLIQRQINLKYQINMIRKLTLTMFTLAMVMLAKAQTADEILDKYFQNIGGKDKWKALSSRKSTGKISFQNMDFPVTFLEKPSAKQRMSIQIQGVEIVQAYDGTDGWMINPLQGGVDPVKMSDEESKEFKDRKFQDEFIDYKTKGHTVELLGTEEIDGVKCYKIQLVKNKNNDQEDVTEVHYFDSENYVPIMIVSYARTGPAKGQEIKTYISDYQDVNGLMMPFFLESKVNGQTMQKITIEKVALNEPIDDSMFAFPKK